MCFNLFFLALFFRHAACFCATLDRVISRRSTVYMVKPSFIRCLFCLEICGGSAKGIRIQLKQADSAVVKNTGH